MYMIIGVLVFIILIGLIAYYGKQVKYRCPPIIDPESLQSLDITTSEGKELLRTYMMYYFDDYITTTKNDWNYVTPKQFYAMDKSDIFILDVRKPEDYKKGHIENSVNIFWMELLKPENLKRIPNDKKIVIVCYVGHTASQILVLLKLLGYDASVLKFGMGISPRKGIHVAGWTDYGYPVVK